ncbi:MAG: substrate-binding domain-containing protein [Planctomycetota bacterium]
MVKVSVTLKMDSQIHGRLASGVIAYASAHPEWELTLIHLDGQSPRPQWSGDGLINCYHPLRTRRPQVLVSPMHRSSAAIPTVEMDHEAAAQSAFEHLYHRNLRRFGVVGYTRLPWSRARVNAFAKCCAKTDATLKRLKLKVEPTQPDRAVGEIASWLGDDPPFDAVFAVHDQLASYVIRAARERHLEVPERLAVIGVDNLELVCQSVVPALSSVAQPLEQIGYRAAEAMDAILHGRKHPATTKIPPGAVHARGSTERAISRDPLVAEAMKFMLSHLSKPLGIEQVAAGIGTTRATLARRFQRAESETPLAVLTKFRLDQGKQMLKGSDLGVAVVARRCGFEHPAQFSRWFRQHTALTPTEFRTQMCRCLI